MSCLPSFNRVACFASVFTLVCVCVCSDLQDGDGQFSTEEVEAIVTNLITANQRVKEFKMIAFAAFVALVLVCV